MSKLVGNLVEGLGQSLQMAKIWKPSGIGDLPGRIEAGAGSVVQTGKDIWSYLTTPKAQFGGLVTRPTHLLAGEAGPEAIIPLDKMHEYMSTTNVNISPTVNVYAGGNGGIDASRLANEISSIWSDDIRRLMLR